MDQFFVNVEYCKRGLLRYISHQDTTEILKKAVIRTGLPVSFSKGFNPRPNFSFYNPLQLGIVSEREVCVIQFTRYLNPDEIMEAFNDVLPPDIQFLNVTHIRSKKAVRIFASDYTMTGTDEELETINKQLITVMDESSFITKARNGKQVQVIDAIRYARIDKNQFEFSIRNLTGSNISPLEFLKLFFDNDKATQKLFYVTRLDIDTGGLRYGA